MKETEESEFIFGVHPVMQALQRGDGIDKLLIQKGISPEHFKPLNDAAHQAGIPYQLVPKEKLSRITRANHQGVIAYTTPVQFYDWEQTVEELLQTDGVPVILYLDCITDVRNMGAIARSAFCFGVTTLLIPARGSARISGDAVKTSAGALLSQKVCRVFKPNEMFDQLKQWGFQIVACTEKGALDLSEANLSKPSVIILGSEDTGISPEWLKIADLKVKIPMNTATVGSFNVSVAGGIVLYEVTRQRQIESKH